VPAHCLLGGQGGCPGTFQARGSGCDSRNPGLSQKWTPTLLGTSSSAAAGCASSIVIITANPVNSSAHHDRSDPNTVMSRPPPAPRCAKSIVASDGSWLLVPHPGDGPVMVALPAWRVRRAVWTDARHRHPGRDADADVASCAAHRNPDVGARPDPAGAFRAHCRRHARQSSLMPHGR
jgi:hypothetical protein